jgi:hypothetical protein
MGRQVFTSVDGRATAISIKREARETFPDSPDAASAYTLGELATLMEENRTPLGKPWPATFWRGLGKELKR